MSRRPSLVAMSPPPVAKPKPCAPVDDVERFRRLTRHIQVLGKPVEPMPWCVSPEAEALRNEKEHETAIKTTAGAST